MFAEAVASLCEEARRTNERRLLVLAGRPERTREAASAALDAGSIQPENATLIGTEAALDCEYLPLSRSGALLGTTRTAVVVDLHDACQPNAIGRAVGAVDGGGLLVLLTPSLDTWPTRRDGFDDRLAVPPGTVTDVSGHFRRRMVESLRRHRGVAIGDVDQGTLERDGLTDPAPRYSQTTGTPPRVHEFPECVYSACLTGDQVSAVHELEALREDGQAVVVEADRGRGKSSAAGLAASALAMAGRDVLITAPQYRNAATVFERASDVLDGENALVNIDQPEAPQELTTDTGTIRFRRAADATGLPDDPDVVIVDEAAALPVRVLEAFLAAPSVAFTTTIHGYEGAGRGFSVRFRDQLAESHHEMTDVSLADPIRYASGDPVEVWGFHTLLLNARPPVDQLVDDATSETVDYVPLTPDDLLADEHLLQEVFGSLVLAHYRTEPDDLARLLDAPNVSVRALLADGHVVSVALLAREGGLPPDTRSRMYDGDRIRGNMLPDVLTTQLRDESAGEPRGIRVLRIVTHHAVRSRGLGSRLLEEIRAEFAPDVDWLGVGFGATPALVRFWAENGYSAVHLSTTRNDESGEYSVLMLDPTSADGRQLATRHEEQFLARSGSVLADPLDDADPDVVRATLRAVDESFEPGLADWEWRHVASAAFGPGLFDMAPDAYRKLAVQYFTSPIAQSPDRLPARQERLLVLKPLQGRPWDEVAAALDYPSTAECMRSLGDTLEPLVDAFGTAVAHQEADRYR